MIRVCSVDPAPLVALLPTLDWKPAGERGTFAMIEWQDFPWTVKKEAAALILGISDRLSGHRRGLTCLSRLVPGQYIPQHFDRHDGKCQRRIHMPLVTNPGAVFVSETRAVNMAVGEVWEFNPTLTHCVANAGATDRIHLFWNLIDAAP